MRRLSFKMVYTNVYLPRQHRWVKVTYLQVQLGQYYVQLFPPLKKEKYEAQRNNLKKLTPEEVENVNIPIM